MNKSLLIICCSLGTLALSDGAAAAQPGGPPSMTGLFPNLNTSPRLAGPIPSPFVVPPVPATLPAASRVAPPPANPIGTALNPPGLLSTVVAPPSPSPSDPGGAPDAFLPPDSSGGDGPGGAPNFDQTLFVQSPLVVPTFAEAEQGQGENDWRRLPTCR